MRRPIASLLLLLTLIATATSAYGATPAHFWSKRFGSTGYDFGNSVATDASGNVFVTGQFYGTVDFGGGNLVSAGSYDIFVAKYSPTGTHQWSQRFGSTSTDRGNSVATDASSNVFVTGYFQGTVDFGGGNLVSVGVEDIFVAKYSPTGTHLWSQRFGGTSTDTGNSVATDASGNVFVTGFFQGTVDFGGGNLVSVGLDDIFVAKYSPTGTHLWSKRFGSTSTDGGYSVATDASGNVFVTGFFQGTVDFGGGNLVSTGSTDIFVAKYSPTGAHLWSKRFGSTGYDFGYSVATDAPGNVFVTGQFYGTVDFSGGNLTSAGSYDIFVAKYSPTGTHQWSQRFGSTSTDRGNSVATDASSNVFVTGYFQGTVDFGGGNLVSVGVEDIFVAKYSPTGAHLWSKRFGSTSDDRGYSVTTDASGNVVVMGFFQGTVDFGGGNLVSAGYDDIFVAKYASDPAEPLITSVADIGNDQGRQVKIRFERSGYDHPESQTPVSQYEAYRRDAPPPAFVIGNPAVRSRQELLDLGWTFVGSAPAHQRAGYGIDVPTIGDSTITLGQYHSVFYIRAATTAPGTFFDSPADSGYSLDNLAPGAPLNFIYTAGDLSWTKSSAADFDFFTVYGANTDAFGSATVVDYSVAATMDVTASPYVYYFVTATDFSGNEGKPAKVNTLSGVGGTPKSYVLSVSNYPNPFNPRTTVTYTAPSPGEVKVHIYDARGAIVKTLFEGHRVAGAYSIDWDGRADNGDAVASGLYFARIEHNGAVRSKKMVLLK